MSVTELKKFPAEAVIWAGALVLLAFHDPSQPSFSLCPVHNAGFTWCPGCGLGKSISFLVRGNLADSWDAHPLGIPAFLILLHRIFTLTNTYLNRHGKSY